MPRVFCIDVVDCCFDGVTAVLALICKCTEIRIDVPHLNTMTNQGMSSHDGFLYRVYVLEPNLGIAHI